MHHRLPHSCRLFLVCIQLPTMDKGWINSRHCGSNLIPDIAALSYISLLEQMIFNSKALCSWKLGPKRKKFDQWHHSRVHTFSAIYTAVTRTTPASHLGTFWWTPRSLMTVCQMYTWIQLAQECWTGLHHMHHHTQPQDMHSNHAALVCRCMCMGVCTA